MEGKENLTYEQLDYLLNTIVSSNPNNTEIKSSQEVLKKYSKNILSVEGYLLHVKKNNNPKARQLAAILLNKKLEKHWQNMEPNIQNTFKNMIIELYMSEKNFLVLKAIANLLYRIAKLNLINGEWNELLNFIFSDPQSYSSEQAYIFELNLYIISELIENCSFYLKKNLSEIKNIIVIALNHGSNKMKENATKCLGNLVRSIEKEELPLFKDVIPAIFKEIKNFTHDTILHIYETLCDFHLNSLVFFEDYFDQMIPLTIEFLQNDEFDGNIKLVLSEFLLMMAECKKKIFLKNGCEFLTLSLTLAYKLASLEDTEEYEQLSSNKI